ncbi:MAG: hypothetical protein ACRC7N_11600 [Clostridium sp.]
MITGEKIILREYRESDVEIAYKFIDGLESKKLLAGAATFLIWDEESWI